MKELLRAAFVIARRDFTATVLSRTFLLFLLGPLFPLLMVGVFGAATAPMSATESLPVGVVATGAEFQKLEQARDQLQDTFGPLGVVKLKRIEPRSQARNASQAGRPGYVAVLEGGLTNPQLYGSVSSTSGIAKQLRLMIGQARQSDGVAEPVHLPVLQTNPSRSTPNAGGQDFTARAGQSLLFLLTILLAGMLLSQLIEEKSNKVIEVLAAAVPVDAIFLGKLLAMLAASLAGIAVWAAAGATALAIFAPNGLGSLPPPAVGWPLFTLFGIVYFAMSYLLLGAIFLGIGAHASSAREVQTLSMPVTMAQVVIFAIASIAVGNPNGHGALGAMIFPLSSPYVMIARAGELPDLWMHGLAVVWQLLWVALFLRIASSIFRKNVLKSGPSRATRRKAARA